MEGNAAVFEHGPYLDRELLPALPLIAFPEAQPSPTLALLGLADL
jgi:hypothetical protein